MNALIKGNGGAVGLTENAAALRRWTLAGPEIAIMISLFECATENIADSSKHHEQSPHFQNSVYEDVKSFTDDIKDLGNPFLEESTDLMTLDTKDLKTETAIQSLKQLKKCGINQCSAFIQERFDD